jgi:molybdopterin/thiamine biosynthesis adenylyltransferase
MHVFQVGAGSGGIVVLDLLSRETAVTGITLVEPDRYAPHNVHRHLFAASAVGRLKGDLAAEWVLERRPDLKFHTLVADLTDPARAVEFAAMAAACDVGVCAVDNEPAKYAFDALMRGASKPWTLGEVLSGGIGGWVHRFAPGGGCYGCVASRLQRSVSEAPPAPVPDYSAPGGPAPETTVPASRASIAAIAALHAAVTLDVMTGEPVDSNGNCDSWLLSLKRVAGVFDEPYRSFRFRTPRSPTCLVCGQPPRPETGGDLDVALGQALDRLAPQ